MTPRYGEPTDEHMREIVLRALTRERMSALDLAERLEHMARDLSRTDDGRRRFAGHASRHRRQAAHFQQAIDLLTAAPMPPITE